MAELTKRKCHITVNLYETENNNRLKTGDPLTATITPGGVQIESSATIPASGSQTFTLSGSGSLDASSVNALRVIREAPDASGVWTEVAAGVIVLGQDLSENPTSLGEFTISLSTTTSDAIDVQVGDRLVAVSPAILYEDEAEETDTISNPIDVPTSGMLSFYVSAPSVDVYLSGDTITDGWYQFNVPTYGGALGPINLTSEPSGTIPASGELEVAADTGVYVVADDSNPITKISHGRDGRLLLLWPAADSVQITTTNTRADGTIYSASPGTITLVRDVPIILYAGGASFVHYWLIAGSAAETGLTLDDLTDVSASSPSTEDILKWDGSAFVPSKTLGTSSNPLSALHISDGGLYLRVSALIEASFDASALTADRAYTLPDNSGEFLLSVGAQTIGAGLKNFPANSFELSDNADPTKKAGFNLSLVASGTKNLYLLPAGGGVLAVSSDIPSNIQDLSNVSSGTPGDGALLRYNSGAGEYQPSLKAGNTRFHVGRDFYFDNPAGTPAWGLYKQCLDIRNGMLIMRVPSNVSGSITIKRVVVAWSNLAGATAVGPYYFDLYHAAALPSTTTAPPAGTAILGSTLILPPTSGGVTETEFTSFNDDTVPADNYIFLAIAGGSIVSVDDEGLLSVGIEYEAEFSA